MPDPLIPLEHRDDDELATLARRSRPDVAKTSLAVLVRRDAPVAPDLARELVTGHADDQVRALAAVALGRRPEPESVGALVGALGDPNPVVLRRVAQSLARVGDAAALAALSRVQPPADTPAGRDVRASRMLLGYRLGVPDVLVPAVDVTAFGARRGEEITFGGRARLTRAAIVASAERELPALSVTAGSVLPFTCSGQPGALALDGALAADPAGLSAPRMLGAMLRDRVCSERYSVDCYLLSDDRDATGGTRPRIWLVRPSGRVVHAGTAVVGDGGVEFTVSGSVAPYADPVKVSGTYDGTTRSLRIDTALVGKPSVRADRAAVPRAREAVMR